MVTNEGRPQRDESKAVHMASLRQFAATLPARRGEALAAFLASLTPDSSDADRLGVVLDACEALATLVGNDGAALARAFGDGSPEQLEDPQTRASIFFALALADRLGWSTTKGQGEHLAA